MQDSENRVRIGDSVVLLLVFENGARNPKEKRVYPAGSRGVVKTRRDRFILEVEMEDPPGVTYPQKLILINKGEVIKSVHCSTL